MVRGISALNDDRLEKVTKLRDYINLLKELKIRQESDYEASINNFLHLKNTQDAKDKAIAWSLESKKTFCVDTNFDSRVDEFLSGLPRRRNK